MEKAKPKRKRSRKGVLKKVLKNACWVCGEPLHDKTRATCGMSLCAATALVYPQRESIDHTNYAGIKNRKTRRVTPKKTRVSPQDARNALKVTADTILQPADWSLHGYVLTQDRRGVATEGGRDTIWGFLSRKNVYLKARGRAAGKSSMMVQRLPGVSVQEHVKVRLMGQGDQQTDKLIDVFYAWRCMCANRHEVIYERIEDLPNEDGYHDACGNCGAAPLEVITCQPKTNP